MDRMLALLICPAVFFTTVTSEHHVCVRPEVNANIEMAGFQRYFNPGAELPLSCKQGYSPVSGPRKIVCGASGEWSKTKLMCIPKHCPNPEPLFNGEMYYEDTVYQSTLNFTCDEGYILNGSSSAFCQANGTWSTPVPECQPVSCGLAPIPPFGMIIYDTKVRGNKTHYGVTGTYKCRPPHVLIGDHRAECKADGKWTKTPSCEVVTCPPPPSIARGYMSSRDPRQYGYMETVKYGCLGDYVLDGSLEIVCQEDGTWSERPSCMGPCRVNINRGRILYKGQKMWIEDFNPNKILHKEIISLYCKNTARNCGYAITTQCINGRLSIPECFEQPSKTDYTLYWRSLPSEIQQC